MLFRSRNAVVTLQADTEITLSNVPYPASGRITLEQDDTGGWAVTWGTAIAWAGGSAPSIGTTAGGRYVIRWWTDGSSAVQAAYDGEMLDLANPTPSASTVYIDQLDDTAMVWVDGVDLSPWAGDDSGDIAYKMTFTDSNGYTAVGYAGGVGGGEDRKSVV